LRAYRLASGKRLRALIDSGADAHMTADRSLFRGVVRSAHIGVRGIEGAGLTATAVGRGEITIDGCRLRLERLYYVPGMTETLISVHELIEQGIQVSVTRVNGVHTMSLSRDGKTMVVAPQAGLYAVEDEGAPGHAIWESDIERDDDREVIQGFVSVGGRYVGNTHVGNIPLGTLLHRRFGHLTWASGPFKERVKETFGKHSVQGCSLASCEACAG
jgi:hypothetical protein